MKRSGALAIAVAATLVAGCAGNPMSAGEFRETVKGGHFLTAKPESFVVDRPLFAVVSTFKKKAAECLQVEASSQLAGTINSSPPRVYAIAKPTVVATAQKMEFYLQVRYPANLAREPEGAPTCSWPMRRRSSRSRPASTCTAPGSAATC